MTRILYWNIRNFSLPKIQRIDSFAAYIESLARLNHILNEVISPDPPLPVNSPPAPDMIIVVEVYSRVREVSLQGAVLNQGSRVGQGVLLLLDQIRNKLGNHWCVVPPLMLGDLGIREGVAVYYNALTLQFTGPYVWTTVGGLSQGLPAVPANLANMANYTPLWRNSLPYLGNPLGPLQLNRTWNAPNGAAVMESQSAGQWEHYTAAGVRINFPNAQSRSPFYTRLLDIAGGRTIKVFSVHTSPASAVAGTRSIADITDLALAANEVGVVVGDFNVDIFNMAVNGAYINTLMLGYDLLLDPRDAGLVVNPARRPYCLTHLLPNGLATPFNNVGVATDPQHNVYPRFGYMGSTTIHPVAANDSGSIDNAMISHHAGLVPPASNTTIVNTVVGKPYTAGPPPPAVGPALIGGYAYNPTIVPPIPLPAGVATAAGAGLFNAANNFQRINSVSDHLAMIFDV